MQYSSFGLRELGRHLTVIHLVAYNVQGNDTHYCSYVVHAYIFLLSVSFTIQTRYTKH